LGALRSEETLAIAKGLFKNKKIKTNQVIGIILNFALAGYFSSQKKFSQEKFLTVRQSWPYPV
jgi:hypothetical protein